MYKLEALLNEFIDERKRNGRSIQMVRSLRRFVEYVEERDIDILRLNARDAREFQIYLGTGTTAAGTSYSNSYIRGIIINTRSFYHFLKRKKVVQSNPFAGMKLPRPQVKLPRNIPSEEEMDALLRHLGDFMRGRDMTERKELYRAHVIAELMYSTGARVGEIAGIRLDDIDFARGVVTIDDVKSGQRREAILNGYAEKVLRVFLQMRALVFQTVLENDLLFCARERVRKWFNRTLNAESGSLGMGRVTSHCFRHAVGYHLLRAGCDIRHIQDILGHRKLSSTQIYTKVDTKDVRGVIDRYHPRSLRPRDGDLIAAGGVARKRDETR